jgi:tRNA threonylcarbamoyladenosine biosynthesis protein TsaB
MRSLFIDTATDTGVVALFEEGKLIFEERFQAAFTNSKLLMPAIKTVVTDIKTLRYIGVGVGPGSYTGIRAAAAMAKGLTLAAHIPLVGISTLRGFIPEEEGSFVAAIDARIGGIYALRACREKGHIRYEQEKLVSLEEFLLLIQGAGSIITPSKESILARFETLSVPVIQKSLDSAQMGSLAHLQFLETGGSLNGELQLLYLRKTQAELERGY